MTTQKLTPIPIREARSDNMLLSGILPIDDYDE